MRAREKGVKLRIRGRSWDEYNQILYRSVRINKIFENKYIKAIFYIVKVPSSMNTYFIFILQKMERTLVHF